MAIDENGVVTFTPEEQAAVDKVVGERLAREKAKYEGHEDLLEISKELEEFGYTGTPAEKKAAIKAFKEQQKAQQELDELEEEAKTTGKDPETAKKNQGFRRPNC